MSKPSGLCKVLGIGAVALTVISPGLRAQADSDALLRPPSVPLVAHDPYFSIWSPGDKLTDVDTTHWTGKPHRLNSIVSIDGKPFRVIGAEPSDTPALPQTGVVVLPTRTIYSFEGSGVALKLTFLTPALPGDIDLLSRPLTYLTYEFAATDGASHKLDFNFDASAELTVNQGEQKVDGSLIQLNTQAGRLVGVKVGSVDQQVLAKKGDDIRIDWGHLYLAASEAVAKPSYHLRGQNPANTAPQGAAGDTAVASLAFSSFQLAGKPVSRMLMLAYDDEYSIQYMKKNLRPYWRRNGWDADDLLKAAAMEYASLQMRCVAFDTGLMADLTKAGGEKYAKISALAYRQCFAAGKFVADTNGQPISFCKENHSNGCIGTSDVFYPMAPQFLLFGPSVAKSFIVPFMNYAASSRWKFPFAPHDIGTYPHANGQVYGDGERGVNNQMPVEESGNLLILMAAVAEMEGNADFAGRYWKQLEQWAAYLKEKGFDPENQLCTDDFAGHLAHNVNLSVKAICGLGSFAKLCEMRGDKTHAEAYFKLAREFAARWVKEADDGEKFRLAFDRSGTWSQKYNLMWDRILDLKLFPLEVARKEMDYYKKIQNKYGLPLDNRQPYTKLDWILWTATLTQDRADFEALVDPVFRFLNETGDRSPMTDWYQTKDAKKVGFTARPVVGGVFAQMLYNKGVWKKWAAQDTTKAAGWAPMPTPPKITVVVPAADTKAATWRYTTRQPATAWAAPQFDDSGWKSGPSGFGTQGTPGAVIGTVWNTPDIWLRREIEVPSLPQGELQFWMKYDEAAEVHVNGVLALSTTGWIDDYQAIPMSTAGRAALKPGRNTIAVHCHQTVNGQYIDVGLVTVTPGKPSALP
ncbi:MAG: DUF4965 domain-containing protein [Akkermansiaceae bacterium]|nr:DUF4965 domain-containing protein [Akkermansiaceae bacterium]MCF7730089.1 DUF4965 domain-containing protein [Akkermansiaceae bacterium]